MIICLIKQAIIGRVLLRKIPVSDMNTNTFYVSAINMFKVFYGSYIPVDNVVLLVIHCQ